MPGGLWRALLALLGLWPGLWPGVMAPPPPSRPLRPPDPRADLDGIISLARALLSDTKGFLTLLKTRYPAEGDHQLESLPVLAMSALELANIQTAGLSRVAADLQRYRRLLEWLRRAGLRPLEPELGALQGRLERLLRRLDHLLQRLNLPRPGPAPPPPPPPPTAWGAVQAGHALFQSLHLYLDWAARALVLLRNRM